MVAATAGVRSDAIGPYLVAGLLVVSRSGRWTQAHLTVDLGPWITHPMVTSGQHVAHDRSLVGGRTGLTACAPDEFPTWLQPALGSTA
ncbi:MAG: hypothetical protein KDB04_16525 [Acidimicrobiales bacterium]|nr:hypothetical protein [Acidimicrobiales bacterium]HRW38221.1 hypothetical protein [Aquihabitans sp.]